jgi:tetratricopeptide (TPR) repeat protein
MVIDNADDADVFFSNTSQRRLPDNSDPPVELLSDFLPQSSNGSILITSRDQKTAWKFVGSKSNISEVKPMDTDDAMALLKKKLGSDILRDETLRLIDALDSMPLALSQAAAFISQRAPRMSISRYVDDINKSDQGRARLLTRDERDTRRDGQAVNSVFATWQISFNYIRKNAPTAARLLSLMSMFDRQGIPETLLVNQYADNENAECDFDDDIHMLSSFSLVKMNVDGREFEMHRLVQFSTKKWLELNDELDSWKANYAILMETNFPVGEYENWPMCRALLPHAQAIVSNQPQDAQAQLAWAAVLYHTAWYLGEMGNYDMSVKLDSIAHQTRGEILGEEHSDTLDSLNSLGIDLARQGKYSEAEAAHKRVLEVRERILGPEHLGTQVSMNNLASVYSNQGRWYEAEKIYLQVVETSKATLGIDHPSTLLSMQCLALTYHKQKRWQEAEELGIGVLEMRKKILGEDHPHTLISMGVLASTYLGQGRLQEAESLGVQVLEAHKGKLGENHPDILHDMGNLSIAYFGQGRWQEAENLQIKVREARNIKLGESHPDTLVSMNNLACAWWYQGRHDEALELLQECVQLQQRVLGVGHSHTIGSLETLNIWRKELAGPVPTAEAREETIETVTAHDDTAESSTRMPDNTAATLAQETVMKKGKGIAAQIKSPPPSSEEASSDSIDERIKRRRIG